LRCKVKVSFLIRLAVFLARGRAYMKLRLAGTANRLNVEHRTSNIERRILMALRFIESKQANRSLRRGLRSCAQGQMTQSRTTPLDVLGA